VERRHLERKAAEIAASVVGARIREERKQEYSAKARAQDAMHSRGRSRSSSNGSSRQEDSVGIGFRRSRRSSRQSSSESTRAGSDQAAADVEVEQQLHEPAAVSAHRSPSPASAGSPLFQNVSHVLYARRELVTSGRGQASVFSVDGPLNTSNTDQALRASFVNGLNIGNTGTHVIGEKSIAGHVDRTGRSGSVSSISDASGEQSRLETLRTLTRQEPLVLNYVSDRTLAEKAAQVERLYASVRKAAEGK
jgi:hypothetical protein